MRTYINHYMTKVHPCYVLLAVNINQPVNIINIQTYNTCTVPLPSSQLPIPNFPPPTCLKLPTPHLPCFPLHIHLPLKMQSGARINIKYIGGRDIEI
jgi:hypothetical protein